MKSARLLFAACATAIAAMPASVQAQDARVTVVQAHVDRYKARDLDGFMRTFAPDAVVVANGITARGKGQIRQFYALNFAPKAPTIKIEGSGWNGEAIYLQVRYNFADGQTLCCSYTEYTVRDGKITYVNASG
ncbi:MAG: nuclear transport factor 2 family protein [Sphingomonadaceae bacterium]|nr:nuclear transport factor 2 family protein [Sphingomonadaceae bacterium]